MSLAYLLAAAAVSATPWSPAAAPLEACPSAGPPRIVFPSDSPRHATGAGAIVWDAAPSCDGGEGARVASLGAGEVPGVPAIPVTAAGRPLVPRAPLAVSPAPHGQIAIAGVSVSLSGRTSALMIQGHAGGPFSRLWSEAGAATPPALATGYLGDVAAFDGSAVRVERYYSNVLTQRSPAGSGAATGTGTGTGAPPSQLTLALDYRSDALAVWVQSGALYARYLPAHGAARPPQHLARVGAHVKVSALLSDAGRATVAWADDTAGRTSVYLDRSAAGVRFDAPRLLERVRDPDGLRSPPGSPSVVRLSTEGVMLAWAGARNDRWVVRTATIAADGAGNATTFAAPDGGDALLAALAPGPRGEALALWSEPRPGADGRPDTNSQLIFCARATALASGRTAFDAPEQVAPPGPNHDATVALDPSDDRAIAAWRGEGDAVRYAIRGVLSGAR